MGVNSYIDKLNARCIYRHVMRKTQAMLYLDALDLDSPSMKICMQEYDRDAPPKGRVRKEICTYIPLPAFLRLSHDVLTGVYLHERMQRRKAPQSVNRPYFVAEGGSEREGKLLARRFTLVDNNYREDAFFAFASSEWDAKRGPFGKFIPIDERKPNMSLYLIMPNETLKEFVLVGKAYAESYIQNDLNNRLKAIRDLRGQEVL